MTAAPPAPILEARHLSKRYGRLVALEDVSFSVRPAEVLGVIGPNGAGKTTLLECVAGILPSDRGDLMSGDRALRPDSRAEALFYVPDGIAPWPAETVRWALAFTVGFLGGRAADIERVVTDMALEPFLDQTIGTLSKGQRKRALLALALLTPQPTLILDEPFDGLDLRQTLDVGAALRRHAASGRSLVLSIHQIADAAQVCDRFVLLSGGRVRGEGNLAELSAAAGRLDGHASLAEVFLALT